jgi:hypothetical protein
MKDIDIHGVDLPTLKNALQAAVDDGVITEDEMTDTIIVLEKVIGV